MKKFTNLMLALSLAATAGAVNIQIDFTPEADYAYPVTGHVEFREGTNDWGNAYPNLYFHLPDRNLDADGNKIVDRCDYSLTISGPDSFVSTATCATTPGADVADSHAWCHNGVIPSGVELSIKVVATVKFVDSSRDNLVEVFNGTFTTPEEPEIDPTKLLFNGVSAANFVRTGSTTGTLDITVNAQYFQSVDYFHVFAVRGALAGENGDQTLGETDINPNDGLTVTLPLENMLEDQTTTVWYKAYAVMKDGSHTNTMQGAIGCNTHLTPKANLVYNLIAGYEANGYIATFNYYIELEDADGLEVEKVRVWADKPGNITFAEANTIMGTLEFPVENEDHGVWFKGQVTFSNGETVTVRPNDFGLTLTKLQTVSVNNFTVDSFELDGTTATVNYTIDASHGDNYRMHLHHFEVYAMVIDEPQQPEEPVMLRPYAVQGAIASVMDDGKSGSLTIEGLPDNSTTKLQLYALPVMHDGSEGTAVAHAGEPLAFSVGNSTTAIESVSTAEGPVEYFNLSGVPVDNPAAGLFIRRQGNSVSKVLVR